MSTDGPGAPTSDDGIALFVVEGDVAVPAPPEDVEVARRYGASDDKGEVRDGHRITVLARASRYAVGDAVRVVHVYEAVDPRHTLYLMGPKPVWGERVDGALVTPAENPQLLYDGEIEHGPGVDFNWEITTYSFDAPGRHEIRWEIEGLTSNTLHVEVV